MSNVSESWHPEKLSPSGLHLKGGQSFWAQAMQSNKINAAFMVPFTRCTFIMLLVGLKNFFLKVERENGWPIILSLQKSLIKE
jgi:hypothetical protein